jgi:hypothetical protein
MTVIAFWQEKLGWIKIKYFGCLLLSYGVFIFLSVLTYKKTPLFFVSPYHSLMIPNNFG